MRLDMYLKRFKKVEGINVRDVNKIDLYLDWLEAEEKYGYEKSLKSWCGVNKKDLPKKSIIKQYEDEFITRYFYWDTAHRYEYKSLFDDVGYWRKANAIHNWFVVNIQDGEDNCEYYEVSKSKLVELKNLCQHVLDTAITKNNVIVNKEELSKLLPTSPGFFFGTYDYDEYYLEHIKDTIDIINKVLIETDFENYSIAYKASW